MASMTRLTAILRSNAARLGFVAVALYFCGACAACDFIRFILVSGGTVSISQILTIVFSKPMPGGTPASASAPAGTPSDATSVSPGGNGPTSQASLLRRLVQAASATAQSNGQAWILSANPTNDIYVYDTSPALVQTIPIPGLIPLAIASNHAGTVVYVTVQAVGAGAGLPVSPPTVLAISTSTYSISQTIDLPQGVNPGHPAISPDDRYLYIPSNGSTSEVLIVDTQNPSSIVTIPVPLPVSRAGITPDGELLFVIAPNTGLGTMYVIDTLSQQVIAKVLNATDEFNDLAVDPTGSYLYLIGGSRLLVYDTATLTQISSVVVNPAGSEALPMNYLAISADGSTLLANDEYSNNIYTINAATLAVTPPANPSPEQYIASFMVVVP